VGVIVEAPSASLTEVADGLDAHGLHVSFAVDRVPTPRELAAIHADGDEALPELRPGGPTRWLGTKGQLHRLRRTLGDPNHFAYVPTKTTLGQYWLARSAGGRSVTGEVLVDDPDDIGALRAGEIVELVVPSGDSASISASLSHALGARNLGAVPVERLLGAY
jgi:hypothetical protein